MRFQSLLLGVSGLLLPVAAQTWTSCNPLNTTCPDNPALGTNHTFIFNQSSAVTNTFNITNGVLGYGNQGAEFTINQRGESPTIQSLWHIMFGSVSVVMKAATGTGIISSIVLQSDDLDEIDWEFMGGNATYAETNYFGKGNTTSFDRAVYYPVSTDVRENFHNYTIVWTAENLKWMIDGETVRMLNYSQAYGGLNYPQTPCTVRLGIWAGGDASMPNGTIEWAGGASDYTKGPYTMYVQQAEVKDYGTGAEYHWGDHSGSWQSIQSIGGNSTAAQTIYKETHPDLTLSQKWQQLPDVAKIGVYAGAGGVAALLVGALLFYFIRQRRAGRIERDAYNAKIEKEREEKFNENLELKQKGDGGWNERDLASQGDDALGGWGAAHATPSIAPTAKDRDMDAHSIAPTYVSDYPLRAETPTYSESGNAVQPATLLGNVPLHANEWHGGNQGGLINDAGNAHTGAYAPTLPFSNPGAFASSPTLPLTNRYVDTPQSSNHAYEPRGLVAAANLGGHNNSNYVDRSASPSFPFPTQAPQLPLMAHTSTNSLNSSQGRGLVSAAGTAPSGGYSGPFQPRSVSDNPRTTTPSQPYSGGQRSASNNFSLPQARTQNSIPGNGDYAIPHSGTQRSVAAHIQRALSPPISHQGSIGHVTPRGSPYGRPGNGGYQRF